jgi:YD repeat-containing protein
MTNSAARLPRHDRLAPVGMLDCRRDCLSLADQPVRYNGLQRLTDAVESPGASYRYAYDLAGNRTNVWTNGALTSHQDYNAANQVAGYTYDNAGNLTNDGTTTYAYDALSRMTARGSTTYSYNGMAYWSMMARPAKHKTWMRPLRRFFKQRRAVRRPITSYRI